MRNFSTEMQDIIMSLFQRLDDVEINCKKREQDFKFEFELDDSKCKVVLSDFMDCVLIQIDISGEKIIKTFVEVKTLKEAERILDIMLNMTVE